MKEGCFEPTLRSGTYKTWQHLSFHPVFLQFRREFVLFLSLTFP
jgi:hypothetical protein